MKAPIDRITFSIAQTSPNIQIEATKSAKSNALNTMNTTSPITRPPVWSCR
jgi:hypothetical protein